MRILQVLVRPGVLKIACTRARVLVSSPAYLRVVVAPLVPHLAAFGRLVASRSHFLMFMRSVLVVMIPAHLLVIVSPGVIKFWLKSPVTVLVTRPARLRVIVRPGVFNIANPKVG